MSGLDDAGGLRAQVKQVACSFRCHMRGLTVNDAQSPKEETRHIAQIRVDISTWRSRRRSGRFGHAHRRDGREEEAAPLHDAVRCRRRSSHVGAGTAAGETPSRGVWPPGGSAGGAGGAGGVVPQPALPVRDPRAPRRPTRGERQLPAGLRFHRGAPSESLVPRGGR